MQTMPQNLATLPDHGHPHMLLTVPMTQTPALIGLRGVLSKPSFSPCRMRVGALGDLKGLFQMLPCESLKGNFFRTASSQAVVFSALCREWAPCLMTAYLQRTLLISDVSPHAQALITPPGKPSAVSRRKCHLEKRHSAVLQLFVVVQHSIVMHPPGSTQLHSFF